VSDGGFTEFVHSRWAGLVRLAYPITLDTQRAEDLAQEALVKLWFSWAGSPRCG
jgi:DNA-directed RNA polymerase specialized sigma24 family protein